MGRSQQSIERRREQNRIVAQKKRDANRDAFREYRRKHYAEHREEIREYYKSEDQREWRKLWQRDYRREKPEICKAVAKRWRNSHKGERKASLKAWLALHPNYDKDRHHRRRGAEGYFDDLDIFFLYEDQGGFCPICNFELGKSYHVDHIIPLAKGGTNWAWNLQLTCPPCNVEKGARMPTWAEVFKWKPKLLTGGRR